LKKICLAFILILSACNSTPKEVKSSGDYYEVWCKHPLGHVMKLVVDSGTWANLYAWKSGVFRFRDIKGVYHQTSIGCYTNDAVRVDKDGRSVNND
jgi:hypothetical protein